MPTAKKLPSGNYRVRVYDYVDENGKTHTKSFTAATKKEAERLAANYKPGTKSYNHMTLGEMLNSYLEDKKNTLSPSTIVGYQTDIRYWEPLHAVRINGLNSKRVNSFLGKFAETHSPKTCRNAWNIFSSALKYHGIEIDIKPNLPEKKAVIYSIPTEEEFQEILDFSKQTNKELYKAILLAAVCVMRRSEICGLRHSDFKVNTLHIHQNMVRSETGDWKLKHTKNISSDRIIQVPTELIKTLDIKKNSCEFVVNLTPAMVTHDYIRLFEKNPALKKCRFHDLRHYGASILHAIGVPDQYIMSRGGWSSDKVMKQVYRNQLSDYTQYYSDVANEKFKKLF